MTKYTTVKIGPSTIEQIEKIREIIRLELETETNRSEIVRMALINLYNELR